MSKFYIAEILVLILLMEIASAGTSYVHANGQTIAKINDTGVYHIHSDHIGSTTAITNEAGEVVEEQKNLPFGELISGSEKYGFTSKELDETGLQYFGARYYYPKIGRFTQVDPTRQDFSSYIYTANNPLNRIDPDGKFWFLTGCASGCGKRKVDYSETIRVDYSKLSYGWVIQGKAKDCSVLAALAATLDTPEGRPPLLNALKEYGKTRRLKLPGTDKAVDLILPEDYPRDAFSPTDWVVAFQIAYLKHHDNRAFSSRFFNNGFKNAFSRFFSYGFIINEPLEAFTGAEVIHHHIKEYGSVDEFWDEFLEIIKINSNPETNIIPIIIGTKDNLQLSSYSQIQSKHAYNLKAYTYHQPSKQYLFFLDASRGSDSGGYTIQVGENDLKEAMGDYATVKIRKNGKWVMKEKR